MLYPKGIQPEALARWRGERGDVIAESRGGKEDRRLKAKLKSNNLAGVQLADLVAFLLYQEIAPSAYMRRTGGKNYFGRLD